MITASASARARAGFTIIEILVAMAIVVILGAIAVPIYQSFKLKARINATKASLKTIRMNIEEFNTDTNQYPQTLDDLARRPTNQELAKSWVVPYMSQKNLKDPWGNKYGYKVTPEAEHPYDLFSYGPKGKKSPKAEHINAWD